MVKSVLEMLASRIGIEPISMEPESIVLSIRLTGHFFPSDIIPHFYDFLK